MIDGLPAAHLEELKQAKEKALAEVKQSQPDVAAAMAGWALNGSIVDVMFKIYADLESASAKMPEEFSINISPDLLGEVDTVATMYLALDFYRPVGRWSFSAKKRAENREAQRMMDWRAWFAAVNLKRCRVFLKS